MSRSVIAHGKLSDPRHIELVKPVRGIRGEVEVVIRQVRKAAMEDVFELIARLRASSRSKADIDRQLREERASWDER
jgi:hypothetical protein